MESTGRGRTAAVVVLLLASFMDLMDSTIVNVALPSIEHSLHTTAAQLEWVVSGYVLTFAAMLITGGRLGDMLGRRTVFIAGTAGFTLASLWAGIAGSGTELVVVRLAQGVFAGAMVPQVLGTVQALYAPRERAGVYGIAGAVTGLAAVAGPLLGGAFVSGDVLGLGWRAIFLVNVPVGVLVVVGALALIPQTKSDHPLSPDVLGTVLAAGGVVALVYPLIEGRQAGWPWWTAALFVLAPVLLAVFVVHERGRARRGRALLLPLRLFTDRGFSAGLIVQLSFQAGVIGFLFVLSITVQSGFGFSAWQAGLVVLPFSIAAAMTSGAAAALVAKAGRTLVGIGALLQAIGAGWSIAVVAGGSDPTVAGLIGPMAVAGAGLGLVLVPLTDVVLAAVPVGDAGSASGTLSTFQQAGGALGIAIVGTVFFDSAASGHDLGGAFGVAAWVVVALGLLAALAGFLLPRVRPAAAAPSVTA
ncbi:MFS transporter [Actinomadura bangladeshensis]|uniref:MFS transporter n=1 Tax=Actinomadura bangladeshensis TaxID=453573 RepID=A0A6L9QC77_9ACTN|nr:MFS transporter [Actinomadura bangladeshensis]NEA23117.1 MFS transporter [Actinomadura bangladeshensis]